jgi:chromosome partitioning protein
MKGGIMAKIKVDFKRLREFRESLVLSRNLVAEDLGWPVEKVARIEDGDSGNTSNTISYVEALCEYYKTDKNNYINYDYRDTKVIVYGMGKGGTGKTTSTGETIYQLQKTSKVLVIDGDPQGNLTKMLIEHKQDGKKTLLDLIGVDEDKINEIQIEEYITKTRLGSNVDIIPFHPALYSADRKLSSRYVPLSIFTSIKKELINLGKYDYVMIDTSPQMSTYTMGLYLLADKFYIPFTLDPYTYDAFPSYLEALSDIRRFKIAMNHTDEFTVSGVFKTMVDQRLPVQTEIAALINEELDLRILDIEIPVFTQIKNAQYGNMFLEEHDKSSTRAKVVLRAFSKLAKEVIS